MVVRMLTPKEVAEELGVDPDAIYEWIAKGELPAEDLGRRSVPRWRITRAALEDFLARRRATRSAQPAKEANRAQDR